MGIKKELVVSVNNFYLVEREEEKSVLDSIRKYLGNGEQKKALLSICGLPGAGKSHLVRSVYKKVRENPQNEAVCIAYADVSDCAEEIEVYYKIARELQSYDDNNPNTRLGISSIKQFIMIYEWIYGVNKQPTVNKSIVKAADAGSDAATITDSICKYLERINVTDSNLDIALGVIGEIAGKISYVSAVASIAQSAVNAVHEKHMKKLLQEIAEVLESKADREELMRKLLITGIKNSEQEDKQSIKPVIILDNFQLEVNNDLGRDQTWLTQPEKLMDSLDAMWIIVSRRSAIHQFERTFSGENLFNEIELQGFSEEQARQYFENNCPCVDTDNEEAIKEHKEIIDKMMEAGRVSEHHLQGYEQQGENYTYLPYLLRLIVLHYRALQRDPSRKITPELFVKLNTQEEIFGYYFYKDLTDLMVNAFQILSCIPIWDSFWIDVVRDKFDNHLLNARNLLFNTAPMEKLGGDRFKIHEAVKDGLYNSSRNYIKMDVLKYLYELFISVYGSEVASKNKDVWYQPDHLQTFIELAYSYINESDIITLDSIKDSMKNIYEANKRRGEVSDSFIRLYSQYIDNIREEKEIPFISLLYIDLNDMESLKNKITMQVNGWDFSKKGFEYICEYMGYCFNLGDLYTNNSQEEEAVKLEYLYVHFWGKILEKISQENAGSEEYFQCYRRKIKALNAAAYDSSAKHDYDVAIEYGNNGVIEFHNLALQLLMVLREEEIITDEEEIYKVIIQPEEAEEFVINSYAETSKKLYTKLVTAYKKLMGKEIKEHYCGRIFNKLLLEEQQNLRGNFPWYYLKFHTTEEIREDNSLYEYGARTYWMRKAILQAAEEVNLDKKEIDNYRVKMQISYHNVCVYLYKLGKVETACILESEVVEQSKRILPCKKLGLKVEKRLESVIDSLSKDDQQNIIAVLLWKKEGLDLETYRDFFEKNENLYEQLQYMGDYYLHMGFYELAVKQFTTVMLYRLVVFGEKDSKTLDTIMRMFIAVYANETPVFLQVMNNYVKDMVTYRLLKEINIESGGIADKMDCLNKLYELDKNEEISNEQKIQQMLHIIDED